MILLDFVLTASCKYAMLQFYSSYGDFKGRVGGFLTRIQSLLTSLPGGAPATEATFKDVGDATEWTSSLLDTSLERVDDALSERRAANSQPEPQPAPPAAAGQAGATPSTGAGPTLAPAPPRRGHGYVSYMQSHLKEKPQARFHDPVDNSNVPFAHKLDHLEGIVNVAAVRTAAEEAVAAGNPRPHPLQARLDELEYPEWQTVAPAEPQAYRSFDETPFTYVDSVEQLEAVASRLSAAKEVAVDLEAHSYRSFQGFCCLMQLSTREEDIVIDTLALRSHVGRCLAKIFADPAVVKVLHGSDSDIVWLQRDYGIYICNLFDTGQAARVLGYPGHGLAYLLDKLCSFKADKRWQLFDWRLRPLGEEALHYARADTHFLLYCYDVLRQELAAQGDTIPEPLRVPLPPVQAASCSGCSAAMATVLERSRRLCLLQYEKELLKEDSYMTLYEKLTLPLGGFSDQQLAVFGAVYEWRDKVARQEDESLGYVLSRQQLISVAQAMPITQGDLSRVLGRGAPLAQRRYKELVAAVLAAKADPTKASMLRQERQRAAAEALAAMPPEERARKAMPADMRAAAAAAAAGLHEDGEIPPPPPAPTAPSSQPAPEGGAEQQSVAVSQPSTLKPRAVKPLSLGSGGASAPGSLFGAPRAVLKTRLPALPMATASSAFGGLIANSGAGGAAGGVVAAAVQSVKASLALPFAAAPADLPPPVPAPSHQIDGVRQDNAAAIEEQKGPEDQRAAVRAAMDQLAQEQQAEANGGADAAEPSSERRASPVIELSDFLPLSVSEQYGLKASRKKRRRDGAVATTVATQKAQKTRESAMASSGTHGEIQAQKLKKRYQELGLEAGDSDEAEEGGGPVSEDAPGKGKAPAVDYEAAAAKYDLGITNPHKKPSAGDRGRGRGRGGGRGDRGGGRSGRGKGRGEEGRDRGAVPAGRFNPYAALDLTNVKGGKRSAVHVRSGNRSSTFKR